MTVGLKWAGRVREILQEARPAAAEQLVGEAPETQLQRAFQLYQFNVGLAPIEQTPRARAEREIHRIALTYNWPGEVARFLDRHGAASLAGLDEDTIDELLAHMRKLLDRAMSACDSDEDLPAR